MESILFTDVEYEALILAFVTGTGGATEEEIVKFVQWAEQAEINSELLAMVFDGTVFPCLKDGELAFTSKGVTN